MIDITKINVEKIKEYLINNPEYFCDETKVKSINDILFFKTRNAKNIVFHDEYLLCDVYAGEIWICKLLKKAKYNKTRDKKFDIEPICFVTNTKDENGKLYFKRWNGCWKIPELMEV